MTRAIVCGGRRYSDEVRLYQILDAARERLALSFVIEGGASGADELARSWRLHRGVPGETYKADWENIWRPGAVVRRRRDGAQYDALAGHVRNQRMIDEGRPELVIAFPGGRGTDDMVRRAEAAGLRVVKVDWS